MTNEQRARVETGTILVAGKHQHRYQAERLDADVIWYTRGGNVRVATPKQAATFEVAR